MPTESEKLQAKLDALLTERADLIEEMLAARTAGPVGAVDAEKFRRRLEHLKMWIESLKNELKAID